MRSTVNGSPAVDPERVGIMSKAVIAISESLVADMAKAHHEQSGAALGLLRAFASLMAEGNFTVAQARETVKAGNARGYVVAGFKASHAQHFVTMSALSGLKGAPTELVTDGASGMALYTLADRMTRKHGTADARKEIEKSSRRGMTYATLAEKYPTQDEKKDEKKDEGKKSPNKRTAQEKKGDVPAGAGAAETLAVVTEWVRTASFDAFTVEVQEALESLSVAIADRMAELAE